MSAKDTFTFQNVRILYPALLRPKRTYAGDGEEYALVALIPKTDSLTVERFTEMYNKLAQVEFKTVPPNLRPIFGPKGSKALLKDGDEQYNTAEVAKRGNYEAYRGHLFVNLSIRVEDGKVSVVDANQNDIISADQAPSGSYGHVVVSASAYKSPKFGPQFSLRPLLVQIIDASQPLGTPSISIEDAKALLPGNAPAPQQAAAPAPQAPAPQAPPAQAPIAHQAMTDPLDPLDDLM